MNHTSQKTLPLSNAKAILCSILIFLSFCLCNFGIVMFGFGFILVLPCISLLLLAKKHIFVAVSLVASFAATVFLNNGNLIFGFFMFFMFTFLGFVQARAISARLTKAPIIAILCCCTALMVFCLIFSYMARESISFSTLYASFEKVIENVSSLMGESLKSAMGEMINQHQLNEIIQSFATSAKLYFIPTCIVYIEIALYMGILVFLGLSRVRNQNYEQNILKQMELTPDRTVILQPTKYYCPIPIPLRLSKTSAVVFIICHLTNMFFISMQNPLTAALSCVYMILLPFFVAAGIRYIFFLLTIKDVKKPLLWCWLICIFVVLLLQSAGISMLGFLGFWFVFVPKITKII